MARKDKQSVSDGLAQIFGTGSTDILSDVIHSDQRRAGRGTPDTPSASTDAASSVVAQPTDSAVAQIAGSESANLGSSVVAQLTNSELAHPASSAVAQVTSSSPFHSAMLSLLAQPYETDVRTGPYTVSTMKIPTALVERLGWVSTLTGRTKQELVAEAIRDYLEKVRQEGTQPPVDR